MEASPRVVSLKGDLDAFSGHALRQALDPIDGEAVVDLRDVRVLSAAALSELVRVAKRTGPRAVALVVGSREMHEILELVQFERIFRIVSRVEDACELSAPGSRRLDR